MERHWPHWPHFQHRESPRPLHSWGAFTRSFSIERPNRWKQPAIMGTLLVSTALLATAGILAGDRHTPSDPIKPGTVVAPSLAGLVSATCDTNSAGREILVQAHPSKLPPEHDSVTVFGIIPDRGPKELPLLTPQEISLSVAPQDHQLVMLSRSWSNPARIIIEAQIPVPGVKPFPIGTIDALSHPNGSCFTPVASVFSPTPSVRA